MNNQLDFEVTASLLNKHTIHVETAYRNSMTGFMENVMRKVLDVEEKVVREALIKLGWTPPPEPDCVIPYEKKEPPQ